MVIEMELKMEKNFKLKVICANKNKRHKEN